MRNLIGLVVNLNGGNLPFVIVDATADGYVTLLNDSGATHTVPVVATSPVLASEAHVAAVRMWRDLTSEVK